MLGQQVRGRAFPFVWIAVLLAPLAADAQEGEAQEGDVQAAAEAFARGQRAQLREDFATAAELFELADQAAPSPPALRSAIRNHRHAGQSARAATLSARAMARYPDDAETVELAREVLDATRTELAHLVVDCEPACSLIVAGRATMAGASPRIELYVEPGEREIVASWSGGAEERREVALEAGGAVALSLRAPEAPPEPPPEVSPEPEPPRAPPAPEVIDPVTTPEPSASSGGGIHPAVFVTGAALTAIGAGVTIGFGVDTLKARDRYVANPTREGYEDGLGRELRTNAFFFGTLAVGLATAILAFFTDWGGGEQPSLAVGIGPAGGLVQLRLTFDGPEGTSGGASR